MLSSNSSETFIIIQIIDNIILMDNVCDFKFILDLL